MISADGGNITLFLHKAIKGNNDVGELTIEGNAKRISTIVSNHKPLKHYLTTNPYVRLFNRIRRYCYENTQNTNFMSGRQLLDQHYGHLQN